MTGSLYNKKYLDNLINQSWWRVSFIIKQGQSSGYGAEESIVLLRVRYSETDQMGSYYNAVAEWFECGRTDYLRLLGLPYTEIESAVISFLL